MVNIDRDAIGILAVLFGILIVIFPDILRYLIGGFLILFGLLTLLRKRV